jgi:hypothetical protein
VKIRSVMTPFIGMLMIVGSISPDEAHDLVEVRRGRTDRRRRS